MQSTKTDASAIDRIIPEGMQQQHLCDLTDAEWEIVVLLMPAPAKTGRPRELPMREIMNAIFLVLRSGCALLRIPRQSAQALSEPAPSAQEERGLR